MKPVYIKPQYQLLIGLALILLVLGSYSYFRYLPAHQTISQVQEESAGLERRLTKSSAAPPSPEKIKSFKKQLTDLSRQADALQKMLAPITQQLAPMNSQTLKLKISQLARESDIYVRANVKVLSKKERSGAPQKPVLPAEEASWLARMAPGTVFYRPMQKLTLEGVYQSLYTFIHGLSSLPYQVTVLRLSIKKTQSDSPPGYPQRLVAEVTLAL
jgi:Tfp pilus assembly protein PilO